MHTLLLLRHAKSDWPNNVQDIDRPLTERGIKDLATVSQRLKEHNYRPDRLITSNALRATTTAKSFAKTLEVNLHVEPHLYNMETKDALAYIRSTDENVKNLMLVGHNPTWEFLVKYFTGEYITMPTCTLVEIRFTTTWEEVAQESGKIIYFDYPKRAL